MNTLSLIVLCLAPAFQDGWRDTHRVHLRNGNFIDGRLEQVGEKEILFRWSPSAVMRIKVMDIRGDGIEEIKIRTLHSEPKKVPIHVPPPVEKAPIPTDVPPTKEGPAKPATEIDKLLSRLMSQPDMTYELLVKEVRALGTDGAKAMIAELPAMDAQKTNLALVALDQMRDLEIEREIAGLLEAKRSDLRMAACNLLANRHATSSLRSVLALLRDPTPQVRVAALMAVPVFGDPATLEAVANLAVDPDAHVRARAFRSAEELSARVDGDNDLAQRWLSLAGRGPAGALGEFASSLGRLGERSKEDFPTDEVRGRLTEMMSDRDPSARAAAAFALSGIKPAEPSADAILAAFAIENEPKVLVSMCDALGRLKIFKCIEPLIERMRDESKDVKPAAQRALEKITGNVEYGSDYEKWKEWWDKSKAQNP